MDTEIIEPKDEMTITFKNKEYFIMIILSTKGDVLRIYCKEKDSWISYEEMKNNLPQESIDFIKTILKQETIDSWNNQVEFLRNRE